MDLGNLDGVFGEITMQGIVHGDSTIMVKNNLVIIVYSSVLVRVVRVHPILVILRVVEKPSGKLDYVSLVVISITVKGIDVPDHGIVCHVLDSVDSGVAINFSLIVFVQIIVSLMVQVGVKAVVVDGSRIGIFVRTTYGKDDGIVIDLAMSDLHFKGTTIMLVVSRRGVSIVTKDIGQIIGKS